MKDFWARLTGRFNALQRREKTMVFAGAVLALLLLGYQFLIEPDLKRQAALARQMEGLKKAQQEFPARLAAAEQRAKEPNVQALRELAELRQRVARIGQEHRESQSRLVPPESVAALLESILRRNRGLSLVSLTTLPAGAVAGQPAAADGKKTAAAENAPAGLYKHGVRITVRGSYPELLDYLAQLEALPQKMYWGRMALAAEAYPVSVMQLTVYTLSLDKSWLVI